MLIAPHCDLPDAALRQHIAVLGKTGSGKTFASKGMIEKLLARPQQVAIIDPTGAWWGLRSSRDGKGPGFQVLVIGGDHGDIPLPPGSGTAVARLIAEQRPSVVIDTSRLTIGERTRWFIDFAGEIYRAVRHPLTLVIDEVHNFVPQGKVPDPDTGKMLHAGNQLFSGGRSRGIRLVGISQRPAKWHKDSLTCVDTLVAMRMLAPQDREAVEAWIEGCGDRKMGRQVLDSLAQLSTGEGWVWYPEGSLLQRVKFPEITTFDSSKTPEDGGPIPAPKSRAEIDLSSIEAAMAAAIEEAKASDPKALQAEVKELKRKLADALSKPITMSIDSAEVERQVDEAVIMERERAASIMSELCLKLDELVHLGEEAKGIIAKLPGITAPLEGPLHRAPITLTHPPLSGRNGTAAPHTHVARAPAPRGTRPLGAAAISGTQRRILDAAAWWYQIGVPRPTRAQVGFVARVKSTGGHFSNSIGPLITGGYLNSNRDGTVELTKAGQAIADAPVVRPTLAAYHAGIREILKTSTQVKVINAVIQHCRTQSITVEKLGELTGLDAGGGHFSNTVGPLSTLGLIERSRGHVHATTLLFPGALR